MNIILDTHILIWFLDGSKKLSNKYKQLILNSENTLFVSIATIWEIALKVNSGKLELSISLKKLIEELENNGFQIVDIDVNHILNLSKMPFHHSDPFDRIILSQGLVEKYSILTVDKEMKKYKAEIL